MDEIPFAQKQKPPLRKQTETTAEFALGTG